MVCLKWLGGCRRKYGQNCPQINSLGDRLALFRRMRRVQRSQIRLEPRNPQPRSIAFEAGVGLAPFGNRMECSYARREARGDLFIVTSYSQINSLLNYFNLS